MLARMGKRRTRDKHLPKRVYRKSGAYYYVTPRNKWVRLGKTEPEMLRALADMREQKTTTFADVLDRYLLEVMPRKSATTQREQKRQTEKLRAVYGKMAPNDITRPMVAAFLDRMGARAPVSANRHIALLSHVMKFARRIGAAKDNPCNGVERHSEHERNRYVSDAEYMAVHEHAPPMMRVLMDLAYLTGQRQGDLIRLKRNQLSDDGILFEQRKTKRKLIIGWSGELRAVVAAAKRLSRVESVYVVATEKGQPYTSSGVQTAWQRLMRGCMAAGVLQERFTFHDIRAKAGSDAEDGRLLGHLDERTLRRIYQRKPEQFAPVR